MCGSKGETNPAEIDSWLLNHAAARYDDATVRKDRVGQYTGNCDKYQDNVKSGDTFKKLAIVSLAVGGAAAVGTIIYYVVDSKEPANARAMPRRRIVLVPIYEPGYAGALVSGSF